MMFRCRNCGDDTAAGIRDARARIWCIDCAIGVLSVYEDPHTDPRGPRLEPCPFCGGPADLGQRATGPNDSVAEFYVACRAGSGVLKPGSCRTRPKTDGYATRATAVRAWNTRRTAE